MSTGGGGRFTRAGYVICSACQAENPATNRFCDRCGTQIGAATRSPLLKPDAAPPRIDSAAPPVPDAGSAPERVSVADARSTGAATTPSPSGPEAPIGRETPPLPAETAPGAAAEPPARGPSSTDVSANDESGMEIALPRGASSSTRPLVILLGITGFLVAVCVALWILLVFLGAIDFTLRGASFATSVATIVATRAP